MAMKDSPTAARRRKNLNDLLKRRANGNVAQFSSLLAKSSSGIYKLLNGRRAISDKIAREIENRLGLAAGWLDHGQGELVNTYYLMVNVVGHRVRGFIEYLRDFDVIMEASALFGEKDVFVKFEATEAEFQRIVLHELQHYPGVRHTQTFKTLERSRWQREQVELHLMPEDLPTPKGFVEKFIERKTMALMQGLKAIDEKDICIHKDDDVTALPEQVLPYLEKQAKSTMRWSKERFRDKRSLLEQESKTIKEGKPIYRILLLDHNARQRLHRVKDTIDLTLEAGIELRVLDEEDWRPTPDHGGPEGYTLYDDSYVIVQKKHNDRLLFSSDKVKTYITNFRNNWLQARIPEDYFRQLEDD